jgi:hypothetical protein
MGIRRVRGRAILVTAVTLALAAGCSDGVGAANASRLEKPVLNVAVVPAVDSAAPFGVSAETAAVMALDSYPVSTGPAGRVDKIRLQRVVDVMQRFLGFGKFDIDSMLMGSG